MAYSKLPARQQVGVTGIQGTGMLVGYATSRKTEKKGKGLANSGRTAQLQAGKCSESQGMGIPCHMLGQHGGRPESIYLHGALIRRSEQIFYRTVVVLLFDVRIFLVAWVRVLGVAMAVQAQQQLVGHHGARKQQQQKKGDICRKTMHL